MSFPLYEWEFLWSYFFRILGGCGGSGSLVQFILHRPDFIFSVFLKLKNFCFGICCRLLFLGTIFWTFFQVRFRLIFSIWLHSLFWGCFPSLFGVVFDCEVINGGNSKIRCEWNFRTKSFAECSHNREFQFRKRWYFLNWNSRLW